MESNNLNVYNLYRKHIDPIIYSEILGLTKSKNVNVHQSLDPKYGFVLVKCAINNLIASDLVRSCGFPNGHLISQNHKS